MDQIIFDEEADIGEQRKSRLGNINTGKIGKTLNIVIKLFHSKGKTYNFNMYFFLYKMRVGKKSGNTSTENNILELNYVA